MGCRPTINHNLQHNLSSHQEAALYDITLHLISTHQVALANMNTDLQQVILIKESSNCKMCMPGTVKCRPTVAY